MTREKLLGLQVKRLLSDVSDHGNQHLTEVETDLAQTDFLLAQAISKLGTSFMAIHEAVCAQQQTLDLLLAGSQSKAECVEKLRTIHTEIGHHVNEAVTGLQFQDMTGQLIGRTVRRVTGLRDILNALGPGCDGISLETEAGEIVALMDKLNAAINNHAEKLESISWKPVQQTHMESGEIELF